MAVMFDVGLYNINIVIALSMSSMINYISVAVFQLFPVVTLYQQKAEA
jgi:hypothetical protein